MTLLPYAAWLALVVVVVWLDLRWRRRFHYHSLWCPVLPAEEVHAELERLLRVFSDHMEAAELPYWLDAGTLLGAWRDGELIPWDDDADVFVMHSDHQRILDLGRALPPEYRMIEVSRLWSLDKLVPGLAGLFPCRTYLRLLHVASQLYIDVFEMDDGEVLRSLPLSIFHSVEDIRGQRFRVPRSDVFPLGTVELRGRRYGAPADVRAYLERQFGPDLSPDRFWSEERGDWTPKDQAGLRGRLLPAIDHLFRSSPHVLNDPCITPEETRQNVRYLLGAFHEVMQDQPITYWLDFGTLLGAYRMGDCLPWDHDGDVSYLATDREVIESRREEFERRGIRLDLGYYGIFYGGTKVDLEPWFARGDLLYRQDSKKRRGLVRLHASWFDDFPRAWIEPRWQIQMAGQLLPCPNHPRRLLRHRYLTYRISSRWHFPHKLKCWTSPEFRKAVADVKRLGYSPVVVEPTQP